MAHKHNTQNPRLCALRVADPDAFIEEVTAAIEKHRGVIANAALELNVERRTLFMWLESYPTLKRATSVARRAKEEQAKEAAKAQEKPRKRKRTAA